jgi:hypothetical protein
MNLKTTTMSYIKVQSEEIVWCPENDRHILIKKGKGAIIGLNYCQGEEIQDLLDNYMDIDQDLTNFCLAVMPIMNDDDEVDQINEAIWAYVAYKND